jgi:hypothetical protein
MLRRTFFSSLCLGLAISSFGLPGFAQQPNSEKAPQKPAGAAPAKPAAKPAALSAEEQVYEKGRQTFADLEKAIRDRKDIVAKEVLGKECVFQQGEEFGCDSNDGTLSRINKEAPEKAFSEALVALEQRRKGFEDHHKALQQKIDSPENFLHFVYANVPEYAYRTYWSSDSKWPMLTMQVLRARNTRSENELIAERTKVTEALDKDKSLSAEQRKARLDELDRKESEARKKVFDFVAPEFQRYVELLKGDRQKIIEQLWCWHDFAAQLSRSKDDRHAEGARFAEEELKQYDGDHLGLNFILNGDMFHVYDWHKKRPYPDVQDEAPDEYVLRSRMMPVTSVASLHPKNCASGRAPSDLSIALRVDDAQLTARREELRGPIREIESQMDAKVRELDGLKTRLDTENQHLEEVHRRLTPLRSQLELGATRAASFLEHERDHRLPGVKKRIEELEKQLKEEGVDTTKLPDYPSPLPGKEDDPTTQSIKLLKIQRDKYADYTSDPPFVGPDIHFSEKPLTPAEMMEMRPYDRESQRVYEALKEIQPLQPQEDAFFAEVQGLEAKIAHSLGELEDLRTELARRTSQRADPAILEVDVSVEKEHVFHAVFNPIEAKEREKLTELSERVQTAKDHLIEALKAKNEAKKAFFDEAEAASNAAQKLGGWTGAIMGNAYIYAGTTVKDVVLSFRKGGLSGSLTTALLKLEGCVEKYVSSGGETWCYEGVDEKKIEESVRKSANDTLNSLPLTMDEMKRAAREKLEWQPEEALIEGGKKFGEKKLDKLKEECASEASKRLLRNMLRSKSFAPALESEQRRLRHSLTPEKEASQLERLKASVTGAEKLRDNPAFISLRNELAMQAGTWALEKGGKKYEEALWRDYFTHEMHSRVLYQIYQGFRESSYRAQDHYAALRVEQDNLIAKCPAPNQRTDSFRIDLNRTFPQRSVERTVSVSVDTKNVDPADLSVEVGHSHAKFLPPNTFEAILGAGQPEGQQILVKVGPKPPASPVTPHK